MTEPVRASRRKYHIIYKTTCLVTGRYYIGMHSTDNLEDSYLGSGLRLRRSVEKYGKDQHQRQVLEILPTRQAAADREKEIITEELRKDPQCLNCGPGGLGVVDRPPTSEETAKKISESLKAHYSSEAGILTRELVSQNNRGKVRTSEMREKYRLSKVGIEFTSEHREKLREAKLGKPLSEKQRANQSNGQSGECTIDGVTFYPSKTALAAALGHGKNGARSPNFRYTDPNRYVQSEEQREQTRQRMLGKKHMWKRKDKHD